MGKASKAKRERKAQQPPKAPDPFALPVEVMKWLNNGTRDQHGRKISRPSPRSLLGMFEAQAGLCCYCGEEMSLPPRLNGHKSLRPTDAEVTQIQFKPSDITRDHIAPKSQGNPGKLFNLAAACRLCNQEKGDLPLLVYLLAKTTNTVREAHRRQAHIREAIQHSASAISKLTSS